MKVSLNNFKPGWSSKRIEAFTLVELLIVALLIVILGAIGLTSVTNITQIQGRKGAIAAVMSAIRLAQTYAITNDGNVRMVFATDDPAFSGALENYKNAAFILMYFGYELDSNGKPKLDSSNKPLPPKWQPLTAWTRLPDGVIFSASQSEIFNSSHLQSMSLPRLAGNANVAYIEFDEMGGVKAPSIGDIDIFIRDIRNTTPIISEQLRINQFTGSVIYLSKDDIEVIDYQ
jgi:type II secretory pathway pseudopilin PulG